MAGNVIRGSLGNLIESWPYFYVVGAALISLLGYVFMGECSRRSYRERETREIGIDDRDLVDALDVLVKGS